MMKFFNGFISRSKQFINFYSSIFYNSLYYVIDNANINKILEHYMLLLFLGEMLKADASSEFTHDHSHFENPYSDSETSHALTESFAALAVFSLTLIKGAVKENALSCMMLYCVAKFAENFPTAFAKQNDNETFCPDNNVKMVLASPSYHWHIKWALDEVNELAVEKYGQENVVNIYNQNATLRNYQNWFSCKALDGIFHIGGEDFGEKGFKGGQAFYLYNMSGPDFSYKFFERSGLDYSNTVITFATCRAAQNVTPGFFQAITALNPKAYIAGRSMISVNGGAAALGCFWKMLLNGALLEKSTFDKCARNHDPMVRNSRAPLFLNVMSSCAMIVTVLTNITSYNITSFYSERDNMADHRQGFLALPLALNEAIQSIIGFIKDLPTIICPINNKLFNVAGLKAAEFMLSFSTPPTVPPSCIGNVSCTIFQNNHSTYDHFEYDVFGYYPEDNDFETEADESGNDEVSLSY